MASNIIGETGLSESGPSSSQPQGFGFHGISPAATNFFDQEGAAYFGGLEEALMQGVSGDRKPFFTTRPPTLEIFPSWPMRFQQTLNKGNEDPEESTDSGSALNTPVSRNPSSEQSEEQKQLQQEMVIMASEAPMPRTGEVQNYQPKPREKKRLAGSTGEKDGKIQDAKTLRRLAQNREAARKSRLRKKAYVQQLESSRVKLAQLEQDLHRARSQGVFLGSCTGNTSSGAAIFDMEYARWLDEDYKHLTELRGALQAHLPDGDLRIIVDECLTHYDEIFRLKGIAAKSDIFHLITGMWTSPAERCFLWIGGFRPSDILKIVLPHLDPLTEQQVVGICNLQQSSQQAEEALSQGLEQLHQSLADTVYGGSFSDGGDVGNYMGHMAVALGKLDNLEGFVRQADNLRLQTLHQLHRILTVRQTARCFLAIGEYNSRLQALSTLWASRPRETWVAEESNCTSSTGLQIMQQQTQSHFSAF